MIYGKLSLKDWRTARVEGETPESSFESYNFRLFFFGTLYNRDRLQSSPADSNANLSRMPIWRIRTMDFPVWTVRLR